MTDPDYAALAAKAQADHTAANERYWQAKRDSEIAAFSELVFHAAAAGVVTVELEPSDQGDWMTVVDFTDAEGQQPEDAGLESALDDGAMDLQDYSEAHWTMLPGVTYESSKRTTDRATIKIPEAAQGLLQLAADADLPTGYRWATEDEMNRPDHIVVPRTVDSTGRPYTQGEADVAVPID